VIAIARFIRSLVPQSEMRDVPMTALETLGWVGLAVSGFVAAGLGVLVAVVGVTDFQEKDSARLIFWLMLIAGIGVWLAAWIALRPRNGRVVADERDRVVLARSFSVESMVVLLSLVTWTVVLTEAFWDDGTVPLAYLQLLFWTTLIGGAMGRSLGIVLGYRREIDTDA
jgi:hypothetical protein